jgi:rare lipoprotein A (peptidoglycan hydrolase)
VIDLSRAAAAALGIVERGVAKVRVEPLQARRED